MRTTNVLACSYSLHITDSMVTGLSYSVFCQCDSVKSYLEDYDVLSSKLL